MATSLTHAAQGCAYMHGSIPCPRPCIIPQSAPLTITRRSRPFVGRPPFCRRSCIQGVRRMWPPPSAPSSAFSSSAAQRPTRSLRSFVAAAGGGEASQLPPSGIDSAAAFTDARQQPAEDKRLGRKYHMHWVSFPPAAGTPSAGLRQFVVQILRTNNLRGATSTAADGRALLSL